MANEPRREDYDEAERRLRDRDATEGRLDESERKAHRKRGAIARVFDDLMTLIQMVRDYSRGVYREVPVGTIVKAFAAVIYFVSPIDLIPDFILGVGYIDDASVIAWVVSSIRDDVERYREWRKDRE